MKKHTKVYMDHFGYTIGDFMPCEICGTPAVDVNHIKCRGMGGSKHKDFIENLMGTCRPHHVKYADQKQYFQFLKEAHELFIKDQIPWIQRGKTLPT